MPMGLGIGLSPVFGGRAGYAFANTEAATYVAAMEEEPSDRQKELIDVFIGELKAADIWDHLDVAYLPCAHSEQAGRLNLKSPGQFTCINVGTGPTFVANEGITGNGTSTAWDTQWVPSTHGVNYTQDNASIWVWCNTTQAAANVTDIGSNTGTARANVYAYGTTLGIRGILNDATLSSFGSAVTDAIGLSGISRASSASREGWKDGASKGSVSATSTGVPAFSQWICAANPSPWGAKQISFAAWGDSLAGKEAALYDAVYNYVNGTLWITGDFIVLNGDSFTNSTFVDDLEAETGLPVIDVGVGGTSPDAQAAVFDALPTIMKKYCIYVDMDGGINPSVPSEIVAYKNSCIEQLAGPRRYVVVEPSPGENAAGSPYRTGPNGFDAQVAAFASEWGDNFIECLEELQALNDASPDDLADIANDIVPRSLRSDQIHEIEPATAKRCELVGDFMRAQGWIS